MSRCASLVGALLIAGCAAAVAPQELKNARDTYAKAEGGIAAQLAPAQLETAKQALDAAEQEFLNEGEGGKTVDLAYIAMRKVELAVLEAEIAQAQLDRERANKIRSLLTEKRLEEAEAELDKTKRAIGEKDRELTEKERTLSAERRQLAAEKRKREEAEKKAAAALRSLSEVAAVKEESRGVVITLSGSVLFATGKYTLLPIAESKLAEVATALKDSGYSKVVVEGHTDSIGSESNNQLLSQRRADAVRAYLVTQGIDSSKISAVGKGESQPIASNKSADGRANNRRVELIVTPE